MSLILKKISDYLTSFVGDISVKEIDDNQIEVSYTNTSFSSNFKIIGNKIEVSVHQDDNLSINFVKNISSNAGFRIKNAKGYYLPNDSKVLEVASTGLKKEIYDLFKKTSLTPLFQYRDSYIFFCLDKKGKVHLTNRHYLEFLINSGSRKIDKKEFSVVIAPDISTFIALFDRGLISLVFPKYLNNDMKVTNLSGFDISGLNKNYLLQVTNFKLNKEKQTFDQEKTTEKIIDKNYLSMKINQDFNYKYINKKLFKIINISVFYG